MRIIAGRYRRRKLLANPGLTTRPITDRAKEQLFENLGGELDGERVADLFSGTGSLGLEALSRGASSAVFFESDRKAHQLLVENIATLGIEDDVVCWKTDALRSSFRPKGVENFTPYELIFFDPPFPLVKKLSAGSSMYKALMRLAREDVSSPEATLILRTPRHLEFEMPEVWTHEWELKPSGMEIHVYRRTASETVPKEE